jgi:Domain of unknown function (DUF4760)
VIGSLTSQPGHAEPRSGGREFGEGATMENASLMVTAVSMLGGVLGFVISTFFVLMQMQSTDRCNKKKTSEELLTQMMTGEFPKLMDSLHLEHNWDVLAHVQYAQRASELDEPELRKLDTTLRNVLRHLEVVCINMKHQIIDEKVCYEYLHSILTTFYETCAEFIAKERSRRKEPRVFIELEEYAKKWSRLVLSG